MGRLGVKGAPHLCKSSGSKNGLGSADNTKLMNQYYLPQIYMATQHIGMGQTPFMEQNWHILHLEGPTTLYAAN